MFKRLSFVLILLISCVAVQAQDGGRRLDRIQRLYEQDLYKKALKKSEKLIQKEDFEAVSTPYLVQSLSLFKLATFETTARRYPHGLRNSLMAYEQYASRNPGGDIAKRFQEDILKMLFVWKAEGERLVKNGEDAEARYYARMLANLFNDTSAHYQHLFPDGWEEPIVVTNETINTSSANSRDLLVDEAKKLIGVPYSYGGTTSRGFDCSGFTGYTYRKAGLELPRSSTDQSQTGKKIPISKAQKGDLIFFGSGKKITHVALVISEKGEPLTVIHATSSKGVMINNIETSSYWKSRLLYAMNVVDNYPITE